MPFEHSYGESAPEINTRKHIPKKLRFEVFKRDSFQCQYCGSKAPDVVLHIDHIKPVSRGGDNEIVNLLTSCQDCNLGKGSRELDDNAEVAKQRAQLEELNERRLQIEEMLAWREGLRGISDEEIDAAQRVWDEEFFPAHLNDHGRNALSKIINKFGLDLTISGIEEAVKTYRVDGVEPVDAANIAFDKLGGICYYLANPEKNDREIYYIRGILKNRLTYINDKMFFPLMREARAANLCLDSAKQFAKEVRNWTEFRDGIEAFLEGVSGDA